MPSAKDLPPRNPFLDAAVAATNNPHPKPSPAATHSKKSKLAAGGTNNLLPDVYAFKWVQAPDALLPGSEAPTVPDPTAPPAPRASADDKPIATQQAPALTDEQAAKALELSLSGSVGFWVAVGLLACWSMEENEENQYHAQLTSGA